VAGSADQRFQPVDKRRLLWSRADDAHLAPQHVQKLRQLVDMSGAKGAPEPRDARIVLRRPTR
jgi:hypothetical protein